MSGAGNQQERPRLEGWISGFVDGEGCFSVNIYRCPTLRLGWQVRPEFVVAQAERSRQALEILRSFFGCGQIYRNRRSDNHRETLLRYCVRRRNELEESIVPFFREVPLRTAKADDFEHFVEVLGLMSRGRHLEMDGLREIAGIAELMNRRRPSPLLGILRDCTPAAPA